MREDLQESFANEVFDLSRSFPLVVRREIDELTQNPNRRQSFRNYSPKATAALAIWAAYMTCNEVGENHWFTLLPSVEETNFNSLENIRAKLVHLVTNFHGGTCYLNSIIGELDDSVISINYLNLLEGKGKSSSDSYYLKQMLRQAANLTLKSPSLSTSYIKTRVNHNSFAFDPFSIFSKCVMNDNLSTESLEEILDEVLLVDDHETKMNQVCQIAMNPNSPIRVYGIISDANYWNFAGYEAAKNDKFPFDYIVNALNGKGNKYIIFPLDENMLNEDGNLDLRLNLELSKTGMSNEDIKSLPYEMKKQIFGITS
jgi:hypothetical protein